MVRRTHPLAYVAAVLLPLALLAALALPLGVVWALGRLRPPAQVYPPPPLSTDGSPGLGDPYYPDAGNGGYDVTKYVIDISWDPSNQTLTGTTTMYARATQPLRSFYVDLALTPGRATVDDVPAAIEIDRPQDVQITPNTRIEDGADFQLRLGYAGQPGSVDIPGARAWWATNQEWTAAGEPESSAWWFPANDHPSDPALMDISIRVPAGMEALSVGRLESRDTGSEQDFDTWHWISRQPMATYLAFVSIGQYELKEGVDQGLPYVYAVTEQLSADQRATAFAALLTSATRVRTMEAMFGPYPFTEIGGIVPAHRLWFDGLETQTRPVYNARSILSADYVSDLLNHELAHMWFGDNVTVRDWEDIFNSEAYASWTQWGYVERAGGRSANQAMNATFDRLRERPGFWQITMVDPSRDHLFDAVYQRGPMTLQALRNVMGDEAFFTLTRDWAQDPGSRTVEEWMARAQAGTSTDLGPFFQAWMYAPTIPERTAANGFRD